MEIGRIEGANRTCGKSQGFLGLPVRDIITMDPVHGPMPFMVSAWEPTPAEMDKLRAGAQVYVHINGRTPPPMMVTVGEPPEAEGPPGPAGFFPISTAPKDGTRIMAWLLWYPPGLEGREDYAERNFDIIHWTDFNTGGWVHHVLGTPTHWQPLPEVPTGGSHAT